MQIEQVFPGPLNSCIKFVRVLFYVVKWLKFVIHNCLNKKQTERLLSVNLNLLFLEPVTEFDENLSCTNLSNA